MRAQMRVQSERLARGRDASADGARIDPIVYVTEARRDQARAQAAALGAGWRGLRRGLSSLVSQVRRQLFEPLAGRSERRRAVAQLTGLDDRLLADIGLRRGDIELAVDGLLADPRVVRRMPAPAAVATARLLDDERCPAPAATANSSRPAVPVRPDRIADRAA